MNIFDLLWIILFVVGGAALGGWLFGGVGLLLGAAFGVAAFFFVAAVATSKWKSPRSGA